MTPQPPSADQRIVYGAGCTWWDGIYAVGHIPGTGSPFNPRGIPGCPHCTSPLFEIENEAAWWESVDLYEAAGHPGYRAMIEWARGKCFPNMAALVRAYEVRTDG